MKRLAVVLAVVFGSLFTVVGTVAERPQVETVTYGDESLYVAEIQLQLKSFGYTIEVDGIYGPQTYKAITHYQRANGLVVDGIVGKQTRGALGLALAPTVAPPTAPTPAPSLPCGQHHATMSAYGLPLPFFAPVAYRESHCDPSAYNGRGNDDSYGIFQINTKGSLWGEIMRRCGVWLKAQLFDATTNIACAAKLYQAYGTRPWS